MEFVYCNLEFRGYGCNISSVRPSIEITTSSKELAEQLKSLLLLKGFRVAKIWAHKGKNSATPAYRVPLNGYENLKMWKKEIGFSNPSKLEK